jgi:hypothetical protein
MQHIIIDLLILVVNNVLFDTVINAKQVVSKSRDHEELLQHTVHVANTA